MPKKERANENKDPGLGIATDLEQLSQLGLGELTTKELQRCGTKRDACSGVYILTQVKSATA